MGDIPENSMTREAQQVFSELAQFGKPRGPDLPLCRRLPPPALQVAKFGVDQRTPMSHIGYTQTYQTTSFNVCYSARKPTIAR